MGISSNLYQEIQEITIRLYLEGLRRWSAGQRVTTDVSLIGRDNSTESPDGKEAHAAGITSIDKVMKHCL